MSTASTNLPGGLSADAPQAADDARAAADAVDPTVARRGRLWRLVLLSLLVAAVAAGAQVTAGSYKANWPETWHALSDANLWGHPATLARLILGEDLGDRLGLPESVALDTATLVVWSVRVPRAVVGLMVGMNLAVSGTIFQAITRNELASPYLLGVSSGAGLAVLLVLVVYPHLGVHLPLIASLGGAAAFLLVYAIAWKGGTSSVRLVLAGVIVASVTGSIQSGLFLFVRDVGVAQDATAWLAGSLTGAGWTQVRYAAPWTLLVVTLALCGTRYMDVLLLGDARAKSLGMPVERARFLLAAVAIAGAATVVSVAGLVGFVGLVVPHIVRSAVGSTSRVVVVGGMAAGAALMVCADAVARLAFRPIQLPVGIVTGVLGGIWFLYLMRRKAKVARP